MSDDLKSRLDAVLARKRTIEEGAASKAAEEQRAEEQKLAEEARKRDEIERDWLVQQNQLTKAITEINQTLAHHGLRFESEDQDALDSAVKRIKLILKHGTGLSEATITLSTIGQVTISDRTLRFTGGEKSFHVSDFSGDRYTEAMVRMLERLYPKRP